MNSSYLPMGLVVVGTGSGRYTSAFRAFLRGGVPRGAALAAVVLAATVQLPPTAQGQFTLVDDFEAYSAGTSIHGQGQWQAEAAGNPVAAGVSLDPFRPSNRVLNIGDGGFTGGRLGNREVINMSPDVRIAEGTTATLFFQMAWEVESINVSIGMSDVANPISDVIFNTFTQFESQLQVAFTPGFDRLQAVNGGSFQRLTDDVEPLTWYDVWMVINNDADATEIFIEGGAFETQTQLTSSTSTRFGFRNGIASNDLVTFFIATGRNIGELPPFPEENIGPLYLDNIHIDLAGRNLRSPIIPEPATWFLALLAALAATWSVFGRGRVLGVRLV